MGFYINSDVVYFPRYDIFPKPNYAFFLEPSKCKREIVIMCAWDVILAAPLANSLIINDFL